MNQTNTTNYLLLLFAFFFLALPLSNAQVNWSNFTPLLQKLDKTSYLQGVDTINKNFNVKSINFTSPVDSLKKAIAGKNPAANINSFTNEMPNAQVLLSNKINGSNLDSLDKKLILGETTRLEGDWILYGDDINNQFDKYKALLETPPLPTQLTTNPNEKWWKQGDAVLQNNLTKVWNPEKNKPTGMHDFEPVANTLFSKKLFPLLEFFGGMQSADASYYGFNYHKDLAVIGIASVKQFLTTWEPRWQAQVSWSKTPLINSLRQENAIVERASSLFNPLFLNGEFAMMYNPYIGQVKFGKEVFSVRLNSSLGVEAGTYAPAHREINPSFSKNNKGYTTGCGAQIGAGFSLSCNPITLYTLATLAYGDVFCPDVAFGTYRFKSTRLEAGIKFYNDFTLRYEMRNCNWANDINKNGRYHQVVVGLPLKCLCR